ncbi:hypothetical protein [Bradyrhizobium sp. SZCCHNRI1009]|uniref:hypothetical protein n=1 Tax=Bradyrhizobium sp. SZCCHNRI1009 TaxID=3057277 RepID=UPI002915D14F|nr:hypothetical protein [Bradyrhizobium sp. SZCCHNRI1009]
MSDTAKATGRGLRLGWHWLWFVPLCVIVLAFVERHTVSHAFLLIKLGWHRWTWGALISPSAAFFLGVIATSIIWPLYGLAVVAFLVTVRQPWRWAVLMIAGVLLLPFVTDLLTWGSFPFIFDNTGSARLRMIPFLPWPSGAYGEY